MVDPDIFEEVVVSEVGVRFFPMVASCDFHVMGNERTDAFTHFFLTDFVLGGVHFCFLVLGLLRKIES